SEHAVRPRRQAAEEVAGHRRQAAAEPRVAEQVEAGDERHHPERRHVEHDGGDEAEDDEEARRPRVPPPQQRLQPLPLRRHVADHRLYPPGDAPQPVVPHVHHVLLPRRRERVELLVQLVGVHRLRPRHLRVHVRRVARPPPVVPQPDHEHVEEHRGEDQLRVPHEDEEEDVHQRRRRNVLPVAHVGEPPRRRGGPREERDGAEEVGLAPPHAPHVGLHVEHVLHHLAPQRRLRAPQPRRHDPHRLVPERVQLRHRERVEVVHPRQQRLRVQVHHVHQRQAGEPHGEAELAHLLHPRRLQHDQRVRVRVHAVGLQRREADADLADAGVPRRRASSSAAAGVVAVAVAVAEVVVVEDADGDDGARVEHLPGVLLVPGRAEGAEHGARADPLLAVLGDAVGVGGATAVAILHRLEAGGAEDADLEHADGRLPELPRRGAGVANVHGGLVHDVVGALQARPDVHAAREPELPPRLPLDGAADPELLEVEPPRLDERPVVQPLLEQRERQRGAAEEVVLARRHPVLHRQHQLLLERLGDDEHQVLVPPRVQRRRRHHRRLEDLVPDLRLDEHLRRAPARLRLHVLRLDHVDAEVPQLGRHVRLGPHARHALAADGGGVGVPRLRERLVGLGTNPHGEHQLPPHL
ncbi:hypothetical protein EE612_035329, partial [Oryza sativa]